MDRITEVLLTVLFFHIVLVSSAFAWWAVYNLVTGVW